MWKVLLYYVVVRRLTVVESISFAILRLSCEDCHQNRTNCCFGVSLASNIGLTTAFCANSCQFIIHRDKLAPILSSHLSPNVPGTHSHIALFAHENITTYDVIFPKICAVEPQSLIARQASIPVLDRKKVYLTATLLLSCLGPYQKLRGAYECSSESFGARILDREKQGVPLLQLTNDCVLGITVSNNASVSHDAFIALYPFLNWIERTIDSLTNLNLSDNDSAHRKKRDNMFRQPKSETETSTELSRSIEPSISTENSIESVKNFNESKERYNISSFLGYKSSPIVNETNTSISTTKVNTKEKTPTSTVSTKEEERSKGFRRSDLTPTVVTNIMDWFRAARATLNIDPPKILKMNTPSEEDTTPWNSIEEVKSNDPPPTFGINPAKTSKTPFDDLT